jgi:eukaryotic-like serine/threonine-protein kinase
VPLKHGTTLGSYTVTAQIGQGGMREVYRARDTKLDRDVAAVETSGSSPCAAGVDL